MARIRLFTRNADRAYLLAYLNLGARVVELELGGVALGESARAGITVAVTRH